MAKISAKLKNKNFITVLLTLAFLVVYYMFCLRANALIASLAEHAAALGGSVRGFPSDWARVTMTVGSVNISRADMLALLLSIILLALLWLFLYKTRVGLGIRASSFDTRTAALMGINVNVVASAIFLLSGATAGLAGCFYGMKYSVYPAMGSVATKGFIASTVGGLGSLSGAVVSGLLLGLLETIIASYVSTTYRDLFAYALLVVVLIFMPNGIMGKRVHDKI